MYIHEYPSWPRFRWDASQIMSLLEVVSRQQGHLFGRLGNLGFNAQLHAMAENITHDVVYSSEIEGIRLNADEVRGSIARRLGIEGLRTAVAPSHYVDAVVAVTVDACEHANDPLTHEKLFAWQAAFFPTGYSNGSSIEVGRYRTHEEHIVSGLLGRGKVHYVAPAPERVPAEMQRFLDWFNADHDMPSSVTSAIAHLWFVSIHPFEDGNGRLSRILADILLARGDRSDLRFYNMSAEINRDKKHYYEILEKTQHGDGEITEWLLWYLKTLKASLEEANKQVSRTLNKSFFWLRFASLPLTERQTRTLNLFLDGYESKINTKQWAALNKCSSDTAGRDIQDLVGKGILMEEVPGAKRPTYAIRYRGAAELPSELLDNARMERDEQSGNHYLISKIDGRPVKEWVQPLDAERLEDGATTMAILLDKYCAYLLQ